MDPLSGGPVVDMNHISISIKEARAPPCSQIENANHNTQTEKGEQNRNGGLRTEVEWVVTEDNSLLQFPPRSFSCDGVDDCYEAEPIDVVLPNFDSEKIQAECAADSVVSKESLYQINENASGWLQILVGSGKVGLLEGEAAGADKGDEQEIMAVEELNSEKGAELRNETTVVTTPVMEDEYDEVNQNDTVVSEEIGAPEEDDSYFEATVLRKVWSTGGIDFYNSDEEEVLTKLADRKSVGKGCVDLRQKKQKQGRKAPCLEGRSLATRTLSLASKTKLK
ncbi:hypothetical protein PIB30_017490 [Stylosanthes scabra]|uniref:Uncharacterized protein n=1 Tax=Stylosanthes scabra TaxID=79078 RepID=A0ABU6Q8D2_9FABA|nr:hypothetical protein [Stylosanthes scabra]